MVKAWLSIIHYSLLFLKAFFSRHTHDKRDDQLDLQVIETRLKTQGLLKG